jgi:restriction endonuclease Mrr
MLPEILIRPQQPSRHVHDDFFALLWAEARREASRDGVPPIELIDGEKLAEMFKKLEFGLKPVKTYEIDESFFEEFRS